MRVPTPKTDHIEGYPLHVVCEWIGNTPKVAKRHYLKMRDEHFAKAIGEGEKPARISAELGKAAHQPAHHSDTQSTTEPQLAPAGELKIAGFVSR